VPLRCESARQVLRKPEGGIGISRYRKDWAVGGMAALPDTGADTQGSGASTQADANWRADNASLHIPI